MKTEEEIPKSVIACLDDSLDLKKMSEEDKRRVEKGMKTLVKTAREVIKERAGK